MDFFELISKLPAFLTIQLEGTNKVWENCNPYVELIGGKVWFGYKFNEMECILYERAENQGELENVINYFSFLFKSEMKDKKDYVFVVDSLTINGIFINKNTIYETE